MDTMMADPSNTSSTGTSTSSAASSFLDPKSTHAFLVGLDLENEWEGDDGDVRMATQLRTTCGVRSDRVVHLEDTDATRDNVIGTLRTMLAKTKGGDTLIFYFGGHGEEDEFCTAGKPKLRHEEVIDVIENYFHGEKVLVLLDCCYSGNFSLKLHNLSEEKRVRLSYQCLTNAPPWDEAGGEDTFTKEWLRSVELGALTGNVTVKDMISRMADAEAFEQKEILTAFKCGPNVDINAPFPFSLAGDEERKAGLRGDDNIVSELVRDLEKLPTPSQPQNVNKMSDSDWIRPISFSIGDEIYAKCNDSSSAPQTFPCWFHGTIVSVSDDTNADIEVELSDPVTERRWRAHVSRANILDKLHFYRLKMRSNCTDAHVLLAEQRAYVSYEGMAPRTKVRVLWDEDDGTQMLYDAEVLSPREASWKRLVTKQNASRKYNAGPYVPVWWTEEESESLVRPWRCILADKKGRDVASLSDGELIATLSEVCKRKENEAATEIKSPREAMLKGFAVARKFVDPKASISDSGEDATCKCYDAESGEWDNADVLKLERIPFQVYAGHLCYREQGRYLLIYWHDDGSLELVPKSFVRKQVRG